MNRISSSYTNNPYKVYRMHPDGSGLECLTCERPEVPSNGGGAQIDPSGRYVVFSAEQTQHLPALPGSTETDPGGGIYNDVAILDLQTQSITRVNIVGSGLNGQPIGGSLFPRFSHAGTQIAWGDYVSPGLDGFGGNWFGVWRILVADFVTEPQPHLANIKSYTPGPRPEFYEVQGWAPDDQSLIVSCAPLSGQNDNALNITQVFLSTNQFAQLTFTAGVQGQPAAYGTRRYDPWWRRAGRNVERQLWNGADESLLTGSRRIFGWPTSTAVDRAKLRFSIPRGIPSIRAKRYW